MIALAGAMFVSLASAQAATCGATHTLKLAGEGDNPEAESCEIAQGVTGGDAEVAVSGSGAAVALTGGDGAALTVTAAAAGTVTLKVTWKTESAPVLTSEEKTYVITVVPYSESVTVDTTVRSVTLEIDDTDDTVSNAFTGSYPFTITTKNIPSHADAVSDTASENVFSGLVVHVSGELDNVTAISQTTAGDEDGDAAESKYTGSIVVPQGTTTGEYTLSVSIYRVSTTTSGTTTLDVSASPTVATTQQTAAGTTVVSKRYSASDVLKVGDAGDAIGAAALSLGVSAGQDTPLDSSDDTAESGFSGSTGEINLNLSITNSLGQAANPDDIKEVLVVAPRASIRYADATGLALGELEKLPPDGRIPADHSKSSMMLEVSSTDGAPRAIDVYVIVLGASASERSETVPLTFTGPLASLTAGDASGNVLANTAGDDDEDKGMDARDMITFTVDATDKAGNTVGTPTLSAKVTGPDGGTTVHSSKYAISQSGVLSNTVHLDVDSAATAPLKTGVYQVTFSSGAVKTDPMSFNVVGTADSIEVEVSEMAPNEVGQTITVTATVMSGDEVVADGTTVTFTSPDVTGDADAVLVATTTETPSTKAGVTSVTYAVVGAGTAVVTATVTDDTTPATDIAVVVSTAGSAEAMPEEEASVGCLSNLAGFATWACGVESSASEIFGLVSGRGATALHLWNGSAWVRYSVVDGTMVPGSSDFMVAENDILYISN